MCSIGNGKAPSSVEGALGRAAAKAQLEPANDRTVSVGDPSTESHLSTSLLMPSEQLAANSLAAEANGENYRAYLLSHWNDSRFVVVGALCIKLQPGNLGALDVSSLAAAAAAMYACQQDAATAIDSTR